MNRIRLLILTVVLLSICVVLLLLNRLWIGQGWDMIFRGDMTYATDLGAQYVSFRAEHGRWPKPEEIFPRLRFHDSESQRGERIDRFECGLDRAYTFEVHLREDGQIVFRCWRK